MTNSQLTRVGSDIWFLPLKVSHVHIVRLPAGGYGLVDTSLPGSAPAILDALASLGARPQDLRQIVITHSHIDHRGSAADLVAATGARVLAGAADAPVIRGDVPEAPPVIAGDRDLYEQVIGIVTAPDEPPLRPVGVDTELHDGDILEDWPGAARAVHAPGHTPGATALHLPGSGVLFPGDTIAVLEGRALLHPFNIDRAGAIASFRRLASLDDVDTLCQPHGEPVVKGLAELLRAATPEDDWA